MSTAKYSNYTSCTIYFKQHQQLQTTQTTLQYTTFTNSTRIHQNTTMYTKLQKLPLTSKLHTPNYIILLYITSNYINYLKLRQLDHHTKAINYSNYNKVHQITPTHLTTATTVTKPNNLKLQQCAPTTPNYTRLYELH